ncbi:MAG: CBS domain-containing protein [Acidobacteria bacterium]|nr:CBS domain-containing protein [Acidobacteriota bacterium]
MKVQDIMVERPKCCNLYSNLAEITETLWSNDCGSLPVVNEEGKVVGMITDRDICVALGTKNRPASEIRAGEVISRKLFACSPGDEIHTALEIMKTQKIRRLPVLDKAGRLQGILCLNDVALHAEKPGGKKVPDLSCEDVAETLKAICKHPLPVAAGASSKAVATVAAAPASRGRRSQKPGVPPGPR